MLTSEQVLDAISDLDTQAEEGYQSYIREQNSEAMVAQIQALRYRYEDSACEYHEPRPRGGWFGALAIFILGWGAMVGLVRWLI